MPDLEISRNGRAGQCLGTVRCLTLATIYSGAVISFCEAQEQPRPEVRLLSDSPTTCSSESPEARDMYNFAVSMAEESNTIVAIEAYRKAIELDSFYCDAMDNMGRLFRMQGELDSAIYWYRRSIAVQPNGMVAHLNLGVALSQQERYDEALLTYSRCIAIDSSNPEGYYGSANVLMRADNFDQALTMLSRAKELYEADSSPLVLDAVFQQAVCYYQLNEWGMGRRIILESYSAFEKNPEANFLLAACYLKDPTADRELAINYLKKSEELGSIWASEVLRELEK